MLSRKTQKRRKTGDENQEVESEEKRKKIRRNGSYSRSPSMSPTEQSSGKLGLIEKVTLKNFMCHANLEFEFTPDIPVHFITGRNGSGKSAVLNGIILALGGKSSQTQRNTNIKGFVQTGKHVADIAVTLCNTGEEAYKPEEYGRRITISRRITDEGISQYKIHSEAGSVISAKKEEINNILNALNIQVDNPVCVLTQEASKHFLESKDPKKKYSFFIKATQLEQIYQQYVQADDKRESAKKSLDKKRRILLELEEEVDKWEKQIKHLEALDHKKEKVSQLENEIAWALVKRQEEDESQQREILNRVIAIKEKASKSFEDICKKLQDYEKWKNELYDQQRKIKEESEGKKEMFTTAAKEMEKLNKELKTTKMKIDRFGKEIENETEHINLLKKSIEELKARSYRDMDREKKRREMEIRVITEENRKMHEEVNEYIQMVNSKNKQLERYKENEELFKKEMMDIQNQITSKENEIQRMRSVQRNKEYLFGRNVPELRRRIDEATKKGMFKHKPVGPVGLHIKVKEQKWAFAIEKVLGAPLLQSYCCDNMADRAALMKIIESVCDRNNVPSTIVSGFLKNVHDVSDKKAISDCYPTVYDMIECEDPVVFNCLIDQRAIENQILIEKSEEAADVMLYRPPRQCSSAFTLEGDQLYPNPGYRYYSCSGRPYLYYLKGTFSESNIRSKNDEVNELHRMKTQKYNENHANEKNMQELYKDVEKLNMKIRGKRYDICINDQKIKCLEITENPTDVSAQEEDLKKRECVQKKIKEEKENLSVQLEELRQKRAECEAKLREAENFLKKMKEESQKLLVQIQNAEVKCEKSRLEKEQKNKTLKIELQKLEQAEKNVSEAEKKTEKALREASELCSRIHTNRTPESLQREIVELQNAAKKFTKALNKDLIMKNYVEKKTMLQTLEKDIYSLRSLLSKLRRQIAARKERYKQLRSAITVQVKILFDLSMKVRNYCGRINFDHANESLDIEVDPKNEGNLLKSHALSGGERSFVTVSFLLALFDVALMPFHVLDEYDVFMDKTNTEASMKLMIEKARERSKSQFIFITPLDLPSSIDHSYIKVHRMLDPERSKK